MDITQVLLKILIHLIRFIPVRKRKILFIGYYGSQYGCSPKYLSEYIVRKHPEWDVVWAFTQPERHVIEGIRKVRYMSLRFFYELCTSQVLVTNYRMPMFYHRRKGQLYIQTWHSSMRLKAIEADAVNSIPAQYVEMAKHDSQQISVLLSGSQKSMDIFKQAFWYDGTIASTGTPRMDVLMRNDETLRREIKQRLGIGNEEHIVLYAPTFRENHSLEAYDLDLHQLCQSLADRWGGTWKALVRLHPHLQNIPFEGSLSSCLNVTTYNDPQELLLVSDLLVTDYSGLMFDFAVTRRPCFLYVPDLDVYLAKERRLYFSLDELPFPRINSNIQIDAAIHLFDEKQYQQETDRFLKQTGTFETGHACENVYRLISEYITSIK